MSSLQGQYIALTRLARKDLRSQAVTDGLVELASLSLDFLKSECRKDPLESSVPGKSYFMFRAKNGTKTSRPVNVSLFDAPRAMTHAAKALHGDVSGLSQSALGKVLYSLAVSYCCAADIAKSGDRKTPGTFFEILVGHLFARTYGANPRKNIQVLNLDVDASLPTDFVFDLGRDKSRIHLPVKVSTRERIIQVWAHQRVLDGIYGVNRFRGILVCIGETNKQAKSNSVIEVCLAQQWAIYQMFIAQLHRIYYLDPPARYVDMSQSYPFIRVKPFAQFFAEADALVSPPRD